jgi:excinuclease ABC subunit A
VLHGLGDRRIKVMWGKEGTDRHGTYGMKYEGVIPALVRRYKQTRSEMMQRYYRGYMANRPCGVCEGRRLRPESLAVLLGGKGPAEVGSMTVAEALEHFETLDLEGARRVIAEEALREVHGRLGFLRDVGLDYLTLDRSGPTLSGGEAQRIRLASQLGSELSGVMYVLDEPSIGLHARDQGRLLRTLTGLRDLGNTVLVVEHDEQTIRAAEHVVDFGPGAGRLGGEVVFQGTPRQLARSRDSLTGRYLAGRREIELPERRRRRRGSVTIRGAAENNLKGIDVRLPLGALVAVTGVSGAGKSSLVNGILHPALARALHGSEARVGAHRSIEGLEALDKVVVIDQKPIGRTPRSNPGTYSKAFDEVRRVFAQTAEARMRGYTPGRFSFNVKGGRCEACKGDGLVRVEMHFLADVYVTCEVCGGKRYNRQTLQVRYRGLNVAEVLDLPIDDALPLFDVHPKLARILRTLVDVGVGYVHLGQPAPTLSGGEAQRVKLARELGKRETGRTLYVLDEPTTGLHFEDVRKLLSVLQRLVDGGNTVIVIEHHLDVVKCADWVVDLGPEGGDGGGRIVAQGTPEEVASVEASHTGRHLAPLLGVSRTARSGH